MTTFIGEYQIHESICDKLVEHNHISDKQPGYVGNKQINKKGSLINFIEN